MNFFKTFEEYNYDKFQPLNPWENTYIFHKDEQFSKYFYKDVTVKEIKEFNKFLNTHKEHYVLLYHGTSSQIPVLNQGLYKTSQKTKKSLQSQSGFVYLSIFPDMAKTFGKMAYPYDDINVYEVFVKIKELKPDLDQLYNKRQYSGINIGNSLAESLIYGHGARVARNIYPYEIKLL